jgi:DNA-binding XRE family transcriptional regulator
MQVTSEAITYDATEVRSAVVRRRIEVALEKLSLTRRDDVWRALRRRAGRRFPEARTLAIGDLHQVTGPEGLEFLAASPSLLSYVFLVRTSRDQKLLRQADIALQLNDEKFFVLDLRGCAGGDAAGCTALLSDYFQAFIERLQPDRVRTARFSTDDDVLWLEFGDGLERAVTWASLPFAARLPFSPVSAAAREHGQSVLLIDGEGSEYELDSGALRSAVDAGHKQVVRRRHAAERAVVGKRIRGTREGLGLSQEVVAERSGIPQESLSRIENGHRDPRLDTLRRLASVFEMDVSELLARMGGD